MEKKNEEFIQFSAEDARRVAQSDAAKKLIALLQQENGDQLQQAMAQASAGNIQQAKQTLSGLLSNPEARALLRKLKE